MPLQVARALKAVGLIVVIGGAAGYSVYSWTRPGAGTAANRDQVVLICSQCHAESSLGSREFAQLPADDRTGGVSCRKCGANTAFLGVLKCPHCLRWIAQNEYVIGSAYVCPHCKGSLGGDSAPSPTKP
jgi:hypothetical protein